MTAYGCRFDDLTFVVLVVSDGPQMTSPGFCWMARPGTCGGIIGGEPCGAERRWMMGLSGRGEENVIRVLG